MGVSFRQITFSLLEAVDDVCGVLDDAVRHVLRGGTALTPREAVVRHRAPRTARTVVRAICWWARELRSEPSIGEWMN